MVERWKSDAESGQEEGDAQRAKVRERLSQRTAEDRTECMHPPEKPGTQTAELSGCITQLQREFGHCRHTEWVVSGPRELFRMESVFLLSPLLSAMFSHLCTAHLAFSSGLHVDTFGCPGGKSSLTTDGSTGTRSGSAALRKVQLGVHRFRIARPCCLQGTCSLDNIVSFKLLAVWGLLASAAHSYSTPNSSKTAPLCHSSSPPGLSPALAVASPHTPAPGMAVLP